MELVEQPKPEHQKGSMMRFVVGELYSRTIIHETLGGGEPQTYLPQHNGQIIAGCFGRTRNPEAPEEIQIGKGPQNVRKAELLARQPGKHVPVFIKRTDVKDTEKVWQYYGVYKFKELFDDSGVLSEAENKSGRFGELTYVLRLEKLFCKW
ncbi:MAG: hypothetical protein M3338_04480 [Actinomycetota bacterium]|nr:hypothetical protein [Actinomycetota bacterium]